MTQYLDSGIIFNLLNTTGLELIIKDQVDSTNIFLNQYPQSDKIVACLAEQQTSGRGRLNRPWTSPARENIYCSIRFMYSHQLTQISTLTLAISNWVHEILSQYVSPQKLKIKWQNI